MFHSHLAVTTGNKSLWQPEDNMTDKKLGVTLEIQLLMDSLSRSKVPVWRETGTRRPLSLKAISVLLLLYGRVRSCNTFQPKNDWVLRNTAMFFVKFTGDAYRWIMMQAKVKHTAEELIIGKRIPCQSTKTFHKRRSTNLQAQSRKPDTSMKLRKSEQELQKHLGMELGPMKAISHNQGNTEEREGCYIYSILGKGSPITWSYSRDVSYQLWKNMLKASRKPFPGDEP